MMASSVFRSEPRLLGGTQAGIDLLRSVASMPSLTSSLSVGARSWALGATHVPHTVHVAPASWKVRLQSPLRPSRRESSRL
jgi:hypothetical protein